MVSGPAGGSPRVGWASPECGQWWGELPEGLDADMASGVAGASARIVKRKNI